MPSLAKKIVRKVKTIGRKHKTATEERELKPNLLRVWPDGTWQIHELHPPRQWDEFVRGMLLESAHFDKEKAFHKEFGTGHAYLDDEFDVDDDWWPSEKRFTKYYLGNNWDRRWMHYIIARLQTLNHIRA